MFGRTVQSDLDFPELAALAPDVRSDTTLVRHSGSPTDEALTRHGPPLGTTAVGNGATATLDRAADGFWLEFSDSGLFHITRDSIQWWPAPTADDEAVRVDIKGRVLPLLLHLHGWFCLHAGAVAIDGRVVAFAGQKRAGKSTLTAALVAAGATLVTDDVLAIAPPPDPRAIAGIPALRLWGDSARSVKLDAGHREPGLGGKLNLGGLDSRIAAPLPIAAVFALVPRDPGGAGTAWSTRPLAPTRAALFLVSNAKNVDLLGGPEHIELFSRAAALAATLRCEELEVSRDFGALPRIADGLIQHVRALK